MQRAGVLLGRREYSRGELRRKLLRHAVDVEVDRVLDRLEGLKLLNDSEYAYNFALSRMRQHGWGPLKVLDSLRRREVAAQVAALAVERVHRESDEAALLREYLRTHLSKRGAPKDRKDIHKLISHLRRRGFEDGVIYEALRRGVPAAAWKKFEIGEGID